MTSMRKKLRVLKRTLKTVELRRFRRFGVRLEWSRILWTLALGTGAASAKSLGRKYHSLVKNWLEREYADVIERWHDPSGRPDPSPKAQLDSRPKIWTLWYQGLDTAPEIIRQCVDSLRRGACGAELIVLDKDNMEDYVDIDPVLKRKVEAGTYSLTKLSNYVRLSLMYNYGGLWLDSTIWLNRNVDSFADQVFGRPFYSVRFSDAPDESEAALGLWATYALGFCQKSPIAGFSRDFQLAYFQREDVLIDYFLFDYSLAIGYETFPWFREIVDTLPVNNPNMYRLSEALERGDREGVRRAVEDESQWFYKTTYKTAWKLYPQDVVSIKT